MNSRRMNRLEELGRVDAEKAFSKKGKRNLRDEKSRIVRELKAKGGKVNRKPSKKSFEEKTGMRKSSEKRPSSKKFYREFAKGGSALKPVKPSQKGLKKLPTKVRNKMGYMKKGGKVGMGKAMRGGGCVR